MRARAERTRQALPADGRFVPFAVAPALDVVKQVSVQDGLGLTERESLDAAHRRRGDGVLHGTALLQRDVLAGEHQKRYRRRDNA